MVDLVTVARGLAAVSGVVLLAVAYWTRSTWEGASARSFCLLLGVLAASGLGLAAAAPSPAAYSVLWLLTYLTIPVAFGMFALDYYGIDPVNTPRRRWLFVLPPAAAGLVGVFINAAGSGSSALGAMSGGTGMMMSDSPAGLPPLAVDALLAVREVGLYYSSSVLLVAAALVVGTVVRHDHLNAGLAVTLLFVAVWPWAGYLLMPEVTATAGYGAALALIGSCYAGSVVAVGLAAGPGDLFESLPAAAAVGPRTAMDAMDDPVLVVDDGGTVLRANAPARRAFGASNVETGVPLSAVLGVDREALTDDTLELRTAVGTRRFDATVSPVADRSGVPLGNVIVLRDVTDRRTREQRLQVLNRVLRHNLRNDMNVIRGNAGLIADGGDIDPSRGAEQIRQTADELVGLSERAREVERMMSVPERPDAEADLRAVVSGVVDSVAGAWPAVEVTTAVPDGAMPPVDRHVLETVLRNVVENACEHNDADEPIVVVSAGRTDEDTLRVVVRDNGPGIPEMERSVIDAGTEDPLAHSTGLGLWAAQWGVRRLGGRLSFADNEPRGTVVRIDLPVGGP